MSDRSYSGERRFDWIVYVVAIVLFGGLAGYMLSVQGGRTSAAGGPVSATTTTPQTSQAALVNEAQIQAYRDILARDPQNLEAAVTAGDMLYDAQRYADAIPFYQRAVALAPSDVNVSTDLGTAMWYAGRADDALAQFDKSLALNPTHPQTLFNAGIVKADGKHDYAGAVAIWEKLLETNPAYDNAARVRQLIAGAKARMQS